MSARVLWFRRDLRLRDNPALLAAAADEVVALFVVDPHLFDTAGASRRAFLVQCLGELDAQLGGALVIRHGAPDEVVPAVVAETGAAEVHIAADYGVYGAARDARVEAALDVPMVRTGSPYAVAPGRLLTGTGTGYKVFTPYYRAWTDHGVRTPAHGPAASWVRGIRSEPLPEAPAQAQLPPAGEVAAEQALERFLCDHVDGYATGRNAPGADATSRLSPYLKYGCIHPRTVLARLGSGKGAEVFRRELAWRDFYADVLWRNPSTLHESLQPKMVALRVDAGRDADRRFDAWTAGRTGYPIVDAGMRQLLAEAWMHNRVRMIVASFLVKDLHIDWQRGARWFTQHLVDGDPASNHGGWQWVAGTGTDPAPFFRVFNPTLQAKKADPDGEYVRRYVPELRDLDSAVIHEPWLLPDGPPNDYPRPIVDHAEERAEALRRYGEVTGK